MGGVKHADREKLKKKIAQFFFEKNGGYHLHGMTFLEAIENDTFSYLEMADYAIRTTKRALKKCP